MYNCRAKLQQQQVPVGKKTKCSSRNTQFVANWEAPEQGWTGSALVWKALGTSKFADAVMHLTGAGKPNVLWVVIHWGMLHLQCFESVIQTRPEMRHLASKRDCEFLKGLGAASLARALRQRPASVGGHERISVVICGKIPGKPISALGEYYAKLGFKTVGDETLGVIEDVIAACDKLGRVL